MIALLDARAGSPPTAGELLRRLVKTGRIAHLDAQLWEWERWAAELLESQLSFPVLAYYRSQHDNQNWLAGLVAILDTCALLLANLTDINRHQVEVAFAMSRHAAVDLSLIFRTPPDETPPERLTDERYHKFLHELNAAGLTIDCSDASLARFQELRAMYEPFITALAGYFEFTLPPVIADEVPADNWQRSAWLKRSPGIGSLPSASPGDHFV